MIYSWLEDIQDTRAENTTDVTELLTELGCEVKSVRKGGIVIGFEDGFNAVGEPIQVPIMKRGIEVEIESETPEVLNKLDLLFRGLKREGGRTFEDAVKANMDISASNPQREAFKLSKLYGMTQQQLANYIDNNVTNLAEAKQFIKKLSAVVLCLVKQNRLDKDEGG